MKIIRIIDKFFVKFEYKLSNAGRQMRPVWFHFHANSMGATILAGLIDINSQGELF